MKLTPMRAELTLQRDNTRRYHLYKRIQQHFFSYLLHASVAKIRPEQSFKPRSKDEIKHQLRINQCVANFVPGIPALGIKVLVSILVYCGP